MNATQPTPSNSSIVHRALTTTMLACFALAGWFWSQESSPKHHQATAATISKSAMTSHPAIASPPSDSATASINLIAPLSSEPPPQYVTKNIEEIVLGQRLVGRNPLRHETSAPTDIEPANWRAIRLTMLQAGVFYELAFLRSVEWLVQADAKVGQHVDLVLPEMDLLGPAMVESIEPCPAIEPDDGTGRMVVTGTMRHLATNILDLAIAGLNEPLGVTTAHPIWSEDRQAFVVASKLIEGEHFRQADGRAIQLTRITPKRGPPEVVYNLEVDGEHVYQVTCLGLLVHNNCTTSIFHGTNSTGQQSILANGILPVGKDDGIFYVTDKLKDAQSWGNNVVEFEVPTDTLHDLYQKGLIQDNVAGGFKIFPEAFDILNGVRRK